MQKRILIKNPAQEIQLIAKRSLAACIFISILVILLGARFAYLQIYNHPLYTTLSKKNWLDLVPLEPIRGLIYDRNNLLIAENLPVFSLDIIPYKIKNMSRTLVELQKVIPLTDTEISQFKKQLTQHRRFDEIPIKLRLAEEEVAQFAENQYRFPGVIIKARLMRHYPYNEQLSHVLGYVGRINAQELTEIDPINYSASHYIGKLGIEKHYEDELHGTVGYEEEESDASGRSIRILKQIKATPGKNLYLTLDSKLQQVAEQALKGEKGAVVVIQPSTGHVLAMVSQPSYDPNLFVLGISQKDYNDLQLAENKPLYDRALRGLYPFASTIKPFFALAGLDAGVITPSFAIYDSGSFQIKNSKHIFHDWQRYGHGTVNVERAVMKSCDIFFYQLACKLGIRRMDEFLMRFGLGDVSGIDLDDEIEGIVASPEWKRRVKGASWYEGDTVNAGIGQGYMQTTPLQLASAVATLANRGKRYIPSLLLAEQVPGKPKVYQDPIPAEDVTLKDPKAWETVIKAMEAVVDNREGTAFSRYGSHPNYTIAAKTGTAQVYSKNYLRSSNQSSIVEKLRDNSLFIAFAPIDKPQISVVVVVENSHAALNVAKQIMDYYFNEARNGR